MQKPTYVVNVDCAVVRDDDYLLIERGADETHASGLLALPGGTVEQPPGGRDTVETTAERELREEVGLGVETVEYVTSGTFEADDGTRCLNVVAHCRGVSGEAHTQDSTEVTAVHWLSPAALRAREDAPPYLLSSVAAVEHHRDHERGGRDE